LTDHNIDFVKLMEPVARELLGEPNQRLSKKGELRFGNHGSLSVDLKSGQWFDHEANVGGGVLALIERQTGTHGAECFEWLELHNHVKPNGKGRTSPRREVAQHPYVDENGTPLFQVLRYEPKEFLQRKPNGHGGWVWKLGNVRQVPYRLPELIEALANEHLIVIVEGEKDVDNLWKLGVPATCNAGGAGKWRDELNATFAGADVVIIADNDAPGRDHANDVAAKLTGVAARVRLLDLGKAWPHCPLKGDISDWIACNGDAAQLYQIVDQLPVWTPPNGPGLIPTIDAFPINEAAIPQRRWIVPGLLLRRHLTVLVAPSASGKSLLTIQIEIACALQMSFAKWEPRQACKVLGINAEDDTDEQKRRLCAAATAMGVNQADLVGRIKLADNPAGVVLAKFDNRTKTLIRTPLMDELIATINALQIDVVIVDPFAETFEGDENSNSELKWAAMLWREVARRTNSAVCLIHHTKKYSGRMAGDVDAARGASALIGVARIVSTLFPMTDKEAAAMEIDDAERTKFVRYDDAKANLNLITGQARWFEKRTYTIGNKTDDLPGDDVGYLMPWTPPGPLDGVDAETITKILDRIDLGQIGDDNKPMGVPYTIRNNASKDGAPSKRWAGIIVQAFLACDYDRGARILKLWIANGTLVEYETTIRGKERKGVRSNRAPAEPQKQSEPEPRGEASQEAFNYE
jgi:hypothetical protein